MTPLTKPVSRETKNVYGTRAVIVTIAPAGGQAESLIGFRLKGKRTQYVCRLSDLYRYAADEFGRKEKAAKREARKNGIPWKRAKKAFIRQNSIP